MEIVFFYIAAAIAILSTIRVVTNSNPVHALLSLIVSLLAVAMIFFMLGAPFAGALEVIVYAGAIMVLFVFVVMMLNLGQHTVNQEKQWMSPKAWILPSVLTAGLLAEMLYLLSQGDLHQAGYQVVDAKAVGIALFGPYLLVVELASVLLLAALVAAYHLGKRED
ncbi:NADH-quinone oxidoreductase subunit J [Agitococcus lubricus]|uniref:NADH-quinone oxidoreductase subunit J n=1 Tax=Agitococcus lubricus TaxID=1077255 RepID=A0A2T5J405_9GAMM|nr:NADH-quinone oxidoreductase subunit J [Agitococcus lubricus]PTQ91345.1 NADH dehydrogenase subunit J [Agitococcus lubricus]